MECCLFTFNIKTFAGRWPMSMFSLMIKTKQKSWFLKACKSDLTHELLLERKVLFTNLFLGRLLIFLKCVAQDRLVTSILVLTENPILSTKVSFKRRKEKTFFSSEKKLVHSKTGLLGHSVYPTENVSVDWLGSLGFSLSPIDWKFYIPSGSTLETK